MRLASLSTRKAPPAAASSDATDAPLSAANFKTSGWPTATSASTGPPFHDGDDDDDDAAPFFLPPFGGGGGPICGGGGGGPGRSHETAFVCRL